MATLRAWILDGAVWKQHWAFNPPLRPALPEVREGQWVRNPIDRFVLARLEAEGLQPAPEADRRALARRVSLDLTGLPPTPREVDAFVRDPSPIGIRKTGGPAARLRRAGASIAAHYWLDAARYADTHGLHADNYREMWPYRDWVIEAFNRNMPFDRFTLEQIAGDLLPGATASQHVATGFHRCNVTTNEGGVDSRGSAGDVYKGSGRDDGDGVARPDARLRRVSRSQVRSHHAARVLSICGFLQQHDAKAAGWKYSGPGPLVVTPREADRARWAELQVLDSELRRRLAAGRLFEQRSSVLFPFLAQRHSASRRR